MCPPKTKRCCARSSDPCNGVFVFHKSTKRRCFSRVLPDSQIVFPAAFCAIRKRFRAARDTPLKNVSLQTDSRFLTGTKISMRKTFFSCPSYQIFFAILPLTRARSSDPQFIHSRKAVKQHSKPFFRPPEPVPRRALGNAGTS